MDDVSTKEQAIDLLQELGLKEYEAKCFVALARRDHGTARDISETSEVPRTRVYDAVRVLESKGLVETQHSNPQVFRAVSIDEAVNTLQSEYVDRTKTLRGTLNALEPTDDAETADVTYEVWALTGDRGITSRTHQLIEGTTQELILIVGHESVFTDELRHLLEAATQREVNVLVGTVDEELKTTIESSLSEVEVFVSGLDWLTRSPLPSDDTEISRLLLADREAILVSSFTKSAEGAREHEHAVFGRGFDNGFVAVLRRLLATGLPARNDPTDS